MNTFNFNRFSQALKCQFLVNRKKWIQLFCIFTLVFLFGSLFHTRVQGMGYDYMVAQWEPQQLYETYNRYVKMTADSGVVIFYFSMLVAAGSMFLQMKDTRNRSAYLLWPVSNLEKYIINLLHSIVLTAILAFAAYVLADALRVFIDWATGRIVIWGIPKLFEHIRVNIGSDYWQNRWMLLTWIFYIHSLYIVGGTLYRRQHFLMTSATIVIFTILLVTILNQIDLPFDFKTGVLNEDTRRIITTFHPAFYILHSVLCILVIFHYWLSYKLFTRMQVINNKWLNV